MAETEGIDANIKEIRSNMKTGRLVIGKERTMKGLKMGRLEKVYIASNCREDDAKEVERLAKMGKTDVVRLKYPNDELGISCKKPFSIFIIGMSKKE